MRFVDLAIDAAALLSASRSVASKHVVLRMRQLDGRGRAPSIAATWREAAAARGKTRGPGGGALPGEGAEDAADEVPSVRGRATSRTAGAAVADDADVPPGIDVNIFHTTRGSKILESLKEGDRERSGSARGLRPGAGGPTREHPLRHWPNRPVVDAKARPPPAGGESRAAAAAPRAQAATRGAPDADADADTGSNTVADTSADAVMNTGSNTAADTAADADSNTATSTADGGTGSQPVGGGEAASACAYQLRESKVPASRLSRMWNYGGLAAGILGGAMTETVSRAFGGGGEGSVLLSGKNTERLVARLSRMRGAALKLGQMMSFQDTKMLPAAVHEVLQRVQDGADYMPAWQRDRVLAANLGDDWRRLFDDFEEKPMAAASIGQVHRAVLRSSGAPVAVKIQFPGVADSINADLDNLGLLLGAARLLPRGLYLDKTIANARLELGWECDYEREARCATRYKQLLRGDEAVFAVPGVHAEASGKQVLTMDLMGGVGVARAAASLTAAQRDWIGTQMMRLCLREMTEFRFMQTDPNWTNFLYDAAAQRLELLDFGAAREFRADFVRDYVRLLEAASRADADAVAALSQRLGYLTGHESRAMRAAHVDSVLTLAEPFGADAPRVYDFCGQTITERVKALVPLMLDERLTPPPEETYSLHRKLSGAFLLCARLGSRVPCRQLFVDAVRASGYVD